MIIQPAGRIQSVQEYYFSRKLREIAELRKAGKPILNLGIGSPDLPPSQEVIEEMVLHARERNSHAYQSYQGIPELRLALADWYVQNYQVEVDAASEILPLMGSKEGIMHISMSFLEEGDQVLVPDPGYPTYRAVALLTGAEVIDYPLSAGQQWQPDFEWLRRQDLSRVKIMWVNYPHMPTGAKASKQLFQDLVDFAREQQLLVVNDNPYSFILNDQPLSIFSADGAKEVALELNSLSKSHNMAGWRIGCMVGKQEYLEQVMRFKSNMDSGMFRPAQMAAVKALQLDAGWYEQLNKVYRLRQQQVFEMMQTLDVPLKRIRPVCSFGQKCPSPMQMVLSCQMNICMKRISLLRPAGSSGMPGNSMSVFLYVTTWMC
jgi:LL-diaminopimelate aminotransferase